MIKHGFLWSTEQEREFPIRSHQSTGCLAPLLGTISNQGLTIRNYSRLGHWNLFLELF